MVECSVCRNLLFHNENRYMKYNNIICQNCYNNMENEERTKNQVAPECSICKNPIYAGESIYFKNNEPVCISCMVLKNEVPEKTLAERTEGIETFNKYAVSLGSNKILIMNMSRILSFNDSLLLAAWLVSLAEPFADNSFEDVLEAVRNT